MHFSYNQKREYTSYAQRSVVMGTRGMVASSQHLASLSGYKILGKGGNAVDAAVAMLSTLNVVEPHSAGIGGDAFALIYLAQEDKLIGMNGSGRAPYGADIGLLHGRGINAMPERGMLSVTVPGALHSWAQAVEQYGKLELGELFQDAIFYAENGFPITEVIAGEWKSAEKVLLAHKASSKTYLLDGKAPNPGQFFVNKDLAKTYRKIASDGIDSFYSGQLCQAIADFSHQNGGFLSPEDFQTHTTSWVEPLSTDYKEFTIYELPPNGQGITALQMLNILEGYDIGSLGHNSPEHLHLLIEAKKIAFHDRDKLITDPEFEDIPIGKLISKQYAEECRKQIDEQRAMTSPESSSSSKDAETVYVTAVDQWGNAASFISSIFMAFGSGMVVDGTGIVLQNRGHSFSLDPTHPNCLAPHKRPMHTIIPGMVFKDGHFIMSFGVMGGDMQPQGHVQFLINLIDFKMNIQEALDAPRVRHLDGKTVYLEDGVPPPTVLALKKKGHQVLEDSPEVNQVGGGQAVYLDRAQNVLFGGSDRRKDGCAIGY